MGYQDPGLAFSEGLDDFLMKRDAAARQGRMDAMAQEKEARLARIQDAELSIKQQEAQQHQQTNALDMQDRERKQTIDEANNMQTGDIPSADLKARMDKYHVPYKIAVQAMPLNPPTPAGIAAPDETNVTQPPANGGEEAAPQPVEGVPPAGNPNGPGLPTTFSGPHDVAEQRAKADVQPYIDSLPEGPEKTVAQFKQQFPGQPVPAALAKPEPVAKPTMKPVFRIGRNGTLENLGEAPADAHFQNEPAPIRVNVGDNPDSLQNRRFIQGVRDKAFTELGKRSTPLEQHLEGVSSALTALNENTPLADNIVGPLIIKATIAGQGSGFRMTQSEINSVLGAGSKWDALQRTINSYKDHPEALVLDPAQRADAYKLLNHMYEKESARVKILNDARRKINTSKDEGEINNLRSDVSDQLFNETEKTSGKGKKSVEDWDAEYQSLLKGGK